MFSYYLDQAFWYPTFVREAGLSLLQYVLTLQAGAIVGTALWGRVSETRLGRRGAVTLAALTGVLSIPIFVGLGGMHTVPLLMLGALLMGICGIGIWGMAPSYLTERFPTAVRAVGPGFAYHTGAVLGSLTPALIGILQDRGMSLPVAMAWCMAAAGLLVSGMIWLGPETRGRKFTP